MDELGFYNSTVFRVVEKGQSQGASALSPYEKCLYLIVEFDAILNMEGITGFYVSSLSDELDNTAEALEMIGAKESARLLRKANSLFPGGKPPTDPKKFDRVFNTIEAAILPELNRIEAKILERPDGLEEKLHAFVKHNRSQFNTDKPA